MLILIFLLLNIILDRTKDINIYEIVVWDCSNGKDTYYSKHHHPNRIEFITNICGKYVIWFFAHFYFLTISAPAFLHFVYQFFFPSHFCFNLLSVNIIRVCYNCWHCLAIFIYLWISTINKHKRGKEKFNLKLDLAKTECFSHYFFSNWLVYNELCDIFVKLMDVTDIYTDYVMLWITGTRRINYFLLLLINFYKKKNDRSYVNDKIKKRKRKKIIDAKILHSLFAKRYIDILWIFVWLKC